MVYAMEIQLIYNAVRCLSCGEVLVSYHRHDYKTCSCEQQTSVDGGLNYERYGGKDLNLVESLSVYDDAPFKKIREYLHRGTHGINGDEKLKHVVLKDIDDKWLQAIIDYEELYRPNNKYLPIYYKELNYRNDEKDVKTKNS